MDGQFDSTKFYETGPCRKLGVSDSLYDLLLCVQTKGRFDSTRFSSVPFSFAISIIVCPCHLFAIQIKDRQGQFDSTKCYEAGPCIKLGVSHSL